MQDHAMDEELVLLVNERDEPVGTMGKLRAHQEGALHRAFSVFLFDDQGRLLLQRRAAGKYHSPGLWTNTCCSHPRPEESVADAARRRLMEEMGIDTPVEHRFSFHYRADFDNGLIEHELDHVLFGRWSGDVRPNPEEVDDWTYIHLNELDAELTRHPERYTAWLRICWEQVREALRESAPTTN
ncbi:MAG: isopentenyl-diphosphate Delta-isomerase [Flavobacteriales bacterium]|jgi:isopentenyl-diphosphate delta-isomerase|nr:MAG: isopentenyl-diphosphate Delta-isomerase [Flavobacteriales bacterium]